MDNFVHSTPQPQQHPTADLPVQTFDHFARFYDADYRNYVEDIDTILELAEEYGDPILELGCGTGRVLLPLAAAGHQVVGIDISMTLLDVARTKLTAAGLDALVALVKGDMRHHPLERANFGFAFCTSNTLMHLNTVGDQLAVLRNAHRHLRPGGLLLVDLFNPDIGRLLEVNGVLELADQWIDPYSGTQVLKWSVRMLDLAAQIQDTLFIYEEVLADGQTRRTACPFALRFLWHSEAELMLQMAGFTVDAVWGDFAGNPYDSQSEHLILLATKV